MLAAFLTTLLFSLSAVSGSITARLVGGTNANSGRLLFATSLLAIYAHSAGTGLAGAALATFLLSGAVGFGLGDAAFFQALPRIGSRLSVILVLCLSAPMGAWVEWLWLGTELTLAEVLCALVILIGVVVALAPSEHLTGSRRTLGVGMAFGVAASICQAGGAVLSRKAFSIVRANSEDIDGVTAAYQRIIGGLVVTALILLLAKRAAVAAWLCGRGPHPRDTRFGRAWRRAVPWMLFNGLVGPALGVSCFQWALKTTPTGVVLPIVAMTPVVIIPFARYIEGERPTRRSLLGGLVAVLGAAALARLTRNP